MPDDPTAPADRCEQPPDPESAPAVDALVREIIGRVADRWTMLILEALHDHGTLRFTEVGRVVGGISQKMLTQTLRATEADGLVVRTVPPRRPAAGRLPPDVPWRVARGRLLWRLAVGRGPLRRDHGRPPGSVGRVAAP